MNQKTLTILLLVPLTALVAVGSWFYFDGDMASVEAVMAGFLLALAAEIVFLYFMIRNDEEFQHPKQKPPKPEIIDVEWSTISGRNMVVSDENLEIWMVKAK
jgi:hypothetical protein